MTYSHGVHQAIMMVESVDGSRALLGRSKRMRPGMMTCLSGFIEQVFSARLASEHGRAATCLTLTTCTPEIRLVYRLDALRGIRRTGAR